MHRFPDSTLVQLCDIISSKLALHFPKKRWKDLENKIEAAGNDFGFRDVEEFVRHITVSPLSFELLEVLATHLTIGETYFWREPKTFEALERIIIPFFIDQRRNCGKRIRIWCAGCSTGEEPYSIAIALRRTIPLIDDWTISILATDINPRFLRKAKTGVYGQWSFRGTPEWLQDTYFVKNPGGRFEIVPEIRNMVTFEQHNLADDGFPGEYMNTHQVDIIFCRNVLMYFSEAHIDLTLRKFFDSLLEGGYFIVSLSELSLLNQSRFAAISCPDTVVYCKSSENTSHLPTETPILNGTFPDMYNHTVGSVGIDDKPQPDSMAVNDDNYSETESPVTNYSADDEALTSYSPGNHLEALDTFKNATRTTEELILLIRTWVNRGKHTEALQLCNEAITANRLDPRLRYLYATILQDDDKIEEAVKSLKHAIFLDSNFMLAYYTLGNLYQRLGRNKSAMKCFENALSVLRIYDQEDVLEESEGITAGRFKEIITSAIHSGELR